MVPAQPDKAFAGETDDEVALIMRAQTDPTAFAELYRRYIDRIYLYIRTRVSSQEDAADLTQQVFLKALHGLPGYRRQNTSFGAWLFQIARNTVTDSYRRQRTTIPWEEVPESTHPLADEDMERHVVLQERLELLRNLLAQLPAGKQELLALRFAAGLTTTQISVVVGRSQSAVKKDLTRILHKLKEHYHER